MRKMTKAVTFCAAAALLTMGASLTSYAAWQQEGGEWIYTDNSGSMVRDSWRQSGNYWFYLGYDGYMVRDQWIDDTYYVNEDGARLTNQWVYVDEGTYDAPNPDGGWFYLEGDGQAAADGWRTINGQRYHFDSDGTMDYGWLNDEDELYYLGDENDGAMKTGWLCLDFDSDEVPDDGQVSMVLNYGDNGTWFYFQTNGQAVKADEDNYVRRTINGYRYYFDENGAMVTGWAAVGDQEEGDATGISTLKYFGGADEGQMATGWRYLYDDPEDSEDDSYDFSFSVATNSEWDGGDGDGAWYYFDNSGVPAYLNSNAATLSEATTSINGQRYFFDEYGQMQSGLLGIGLPDGTVVSAYFGADDSDGAMKRERQTNVYDDDGERGTYYFNGSGENRGAGYSGERNGYLYYNGKLVEAEDGEDFQVFEVDGQLYLVNEAGRVQDSDRTYRVNGEYYYEYEDGTIYRINDDRERLYEVTSADARRLPSIAYRDIYYL